MYPYASLAFAGRLVARKGSKVGKQESLMITSVQIFSFASSEFQNGLASRMAITRGWMGIQLNKMLAVRL